MSDLFERRIQPVLGPIGEDVQAVEIVRPPFSGRDWFESILNLAAVAFLYGWFLMLLIPVFASWAPGYWQCVSIVLVVRLLFPSDMYLMWTRRSR